MNKTVMLALALLLWTLSLSEAAAAGQDCRVLADGRIHCQPAGPIVSCPPGTTPVGGGCRRF
jgi:hypothetical protein